MFPANLTRVSGDQPQWWATYCIATMINCVSANRPDQLTLWASAMGATSLLFLPPDELLLSGVGIVSDGQEAIVGFQGTYNGYQGVTEILLTPQTTSPGVPGQVHGYFGACFQSRLAAMSAIIGALPPGFPALFSGHSAGGAIAEIACKYFCTNGPLASAGLISFGAPRAGNGQFSAASAEPILRVITQNDLVPSLPPRTSPVLAIIGNVANISYGWNYTHSSLGWILLNGGGTRRGTTAIVDSWGPPNPIPALRLQAAIPAMFAAHLLTNYCAMLLALANVQGSPINLAAMIAINAAIG
jgi:hypothetical protein